MVIAYIGNVNQSSIRTDARLATKHITIARRIQTVCARQAKVATVRTSVWPAE